MGFVTKHNSFKEAHDGTQRCPSQDGVLPFAFERRPAVAVASRVPVSVDCNRSLRRYGSSTFDTDPKGDGRTPRYRTRYCTRRGGRDQLPRHALNRPCSELILPPDLLE